METVVIWVSNPEPPFFAFLVGVGFSNFTSTISFLPLEFGAMSVETALPFIRTVVSKIELFGVALELILKT